MTRASYTCDNFQLYDKGDEYRSSTSVNGTRRWQLYECECGALTMPFSGWDVQRVKNGWDALFQKWDTSFFDGTRSFKLVECWLLAGEYSG